MKFSLMTALVVAASLSLPVAMAQSGGQGEYTVGDRLSAGVGKSDGFTEIEWDDLIPPDWMPENMFEELFDEAGLDTLDDADPRAMELMQKVREAWDNAPVVDRMHDRRVRVPGFVVPLESDDKTIREFLLVPYFGACIHVPPPPANQLIHVIPDKPIPAEWNMVPVWVSGVMRVERHASDLGSAGYAMRGMKIVEYE